MIVGINVGHYTALPVMEAQVGLLHGWPVVRTMEWSRVNITHTGQTRPPWAFARETPAPYTRGPWHQWPGVSVKDQIAAVNAVGARGWFCAPSWWGDDDLLEWARYVIEHSDQRPVLEWSNEIWNGCFAQQGTLGDWPAPLREQSRRTTLIKSYVGDNAQVVLCVQANNPGIARFLLAHRPRFDALAIAPYMLDPGDLASVQRRVWSHIALAQEFGVPLWCYEMGYHDVRNANDVPPVTPYRVGVVQAYLRILAEAGIEMGCWYSLTGGAWGLHQTLKPVDDRIEPLRLAVIAQRDGLAL